MVGNKSDLVDGIYFTKYEVLADLIAIDFFMTSAKTGDQVEGAFAVMGEYILNRG